MNFCFAGYTCKKKVLVVEKTTFILKLFLGLSESQTEYDSEIMQIKDSPAVILQLEHTLEGF